jgi:hypothetical protein
MARIRTIKEDFFQNEKMASCSAHAQLLAIGLLPQCDDEGYFEAHPKLIKARVFPFSDDSVNIHGLLTELSNIDYLQLIECSGRTYGIIPGFLRHQKVNRPTPSKIKEVIISQGKLNEDSVSNHGGLTLGKEGKGKEEEGKGKECDADASPYPSATSLSLSKEHLDICKEKKLNVEFEIEKYLNNRKHTGKTPSEADFLFWLARAFPNKNIPQLPPAKALPASPEQVKAEKLRIDISGLIAQKELCIKHNQIERWEKLFEPELIAKQTELKALEISA